MHQKVRRRVVGSACRIGAQVVDPDSTDVGDLADHPRPALGTLAPVVPGPDPSHGSHDSPRCSRLAKRKRSYTGPRHEHLTHDQVIKGAWILIWTPYRSCLISCVSWMHRVYATETHETFHQESGMRYQVPSSPIRE